MNTKEIFNKMKEENKNQEEQLKQKIIEGNENLKMKLDKIKKDMEKISIYSNVTYETIKTTTPINEEAAKIMRYDNKEKVMKMIEEEKSTRRGIEPLADEEQEDEEEAASTMKRNTNNSMGMSNDHDHNEFTSNKKKEENNEDNAYDSNNKTNNQLSQEKENSIQKNKAKELIQSSLEEENKINKAPKSCSKGNQDDCNRRNNKSNDYYNAHSNSNTFKQNNSPNTIKKQDLTQKPKPKLNNQNPNIIYEKSKSKQSSNTKTPKVPLTTIKHSKSPEKPISNEYNQDNIDSDKENPETHENHILYHSSYAKSLQNQQQQPDIEFNSSNNSNFNSHSQFPSTQPIQSNNDSKTKSSQSPNFQSQIHQYHQQQHQQYNSNSNTANDFYSNSQSQFQTGGQGKGQGGFYRNEEDDLCISNNHCKHKEKNNNINNDSQCDSSGNPTRKNFYGTNSSGQKFNNNSIGNENHDNNQDYSNNDSYMNDTRKDLNANSNTNLRQSQMESASNYYQIANSPVIHSKRIYKSDEQDSMIKKSNKMKYNYNNNDNEGKDKGNNSIAFGRSTHNTNPNQNALRQSSETTNEKKNKNDQKNTKIIFELRNQIDVLKKKNDRLEKNKPKNHISKSQRKSSQGKKPLDKKKVKISFGADEYEDYKIYEKTVLDKMAKEEVYDGIGETKDILGEFVDHVIERSLYLYKNRHCHQCATLLSKGNSTHKCPKYHHKLQ